MIRREGNKIILEGEDRQYAEALDKYACMAKAQEALALSVGSYRRKADMAFDQLREKCDFIKDDEDISYSHTDDGFFIRKK